jgi:hypothetical protein
MDQHPLSRDSFVPQDTQVIVALGGILNIRSALSLGERALVF